MRTPLLPSLLFALLTSASVAVTAAPAQNAMSDTMKPAHGAAASAAMMDPASAHMSAGKVDLNTADAATLQKELSGIGKNKADAIVAHREANGPFTSVDEIIEVKGIGKSILEKNRDKLSIQ